ncbi:hypothetical protein PHYSODRAFT_252960 [Phytophthora sojae]|uniref:FYVE-type domain-containing protein n=1 Tax=Phytophthora sojae (strain P6497) TaxID=1094619 RepID=G4ZQ47_PHYSP|nr:hypothetical protein PHYSODRAFT_252960 [Phytophthora sojae]EGZ14436.1 hypothetical protein PHYSODRAFT_252960 [Phytophthora sojae]|eukprot:XP_009528185.1 hypothetical protein PHYSODRAFT_252960 [Phytophthora sojae]
MVKGRFIVNPFAELSLTEHDHVQLQDLANSVIMAHLDKWSIYKSEKMQVEERQNIRMYTERSSSTSSGELITGNGLPIILAVGTLQGQLDDLMHGVMSPTLESMRIKASYVDDFDGAAVLDTLVEPSLDDPFQTLVLKWMEVDIPLVKNRDYVPPPANAWVRGNISALAFWQQTGPNTIDMWGTAVMDLGGDMIRMVAVPAMVGAFMSSVKYGFCGQIRKLAWVLEQRYEESRQRGTPNKTSDCVTCFSPISGRKLGDFGKSNNTCKLCFGFVCRACQLVRKMSFVDPDLQLSQRKVTFCSACVGQVMSLSSTDAARAMMLSKKGHSKVHNSLSSSASTTSSMSSMSM